MFKPADASKPKDAPDESLIAKSLKELIRWGPTKGGKSKVNKINHEFFMFFKLLIVTVFIVAGVTIVMFNLPRSMLPKPLPTPDDKQIAMLGYPGQKAKDVTYGQKLAFSIFMQYFQMDRDYLEQGSGYDNTLSHWEQSYMTHTTISVFSFIALGILFTIAFGWFNVIAGTAHPKYYINKTIHFQVLTHILTGSLNHFLYAYLYFCRPNDVWYKVSSLCILSSLWHAVTVFYMTVWNNVIIGDRYMVSACLTAAVPFKILFAWGCWMLPGSRDIMLATFLALTGFMLTRLYILLQSLGGLFLTKMNYSMGVMNASMSAWIWAFGLTGPVIFYIWVFFYRVLNRIFDIVPKEQKIYYKRNMFEGRRSVYTRVAERMKDLGLTNAFVEDSHKALESLDEDQRKSLLMTAMSENGQKSLSLEEVCKLFPGISADSIQQVIDSKGDGKKIDCEVFFKQMGKKAMWCMDEYFTETLQRASVLPVMKSVGGYKPGTGLLGAAEIEKIKNSMHKKGGAKKPVPKQKEAAPAASGTCEGGPANQGGMFSEAWNNLTQTNQGCPYKAMVGKCE